MLLRGYAADSDRPSRFLLIVIYIRCQFRLTYSVLILRFRKIRGIKNANRANLLAQKKYKSETLMRRIGRCWFYRRIPGVTSRCIGSKFARTVGNTAIYRIECARSGTGCTNIVNAILAGRHEPPPVKKYCVACVQSNFGLVAKAAHTLKIIASDIKVHFIFFIRNCVWLL